MLKLRNEEINAKKIIAVKDVTYAFVKRKPEKYWVSAPLLQNDSHSYREIFLNSSVSDAKAYVDFILNSIRRKDLFHSIELKPESCWEYLMWMDQVIAIIIIAKNHKFKKFRVELSFVKDSQGSLINLSIF